jgi:hypothetical protein
MRTLRALAAAAPGAALFGVPQTALAHSFGKLYTLPVPVWLYLYGAAAALLVSFLVIGYFVGTPQAAHRNFATRPLPRAFEWLAAPAAVRVLQLLSLALLLLSIATGLWGTRNPYANFNMTFFWIVFVLAYTYTVALLGDSYRVLNPWQQLAQGASSVSRQFAVGRYDYPQRFSYLPALALYMAFIWIELFGNVRPLSLSVLLLGYAGLTLTGCWLWGQAAWFRYGDFFSVFFRITGMMSVIERRDGRFQLRQPFIGLLRERCEDFSLLLFVMFMLSSTAYDGMHNTVPWVRVFWQDLKPLFEPIVGTDIVRSFPVLKQMYFVYQSLALILSPLLYLSIYVAMIAAAKAITRSPRSLRELCLDFGYTLVPIALVYNVTHYYTLIAQQGVLVIKLISDPFGFGWNLFGTAGWLSKPPMLDVGTIWHTQVALILVGHIVSVYLAHIVALRVFVTPRQALLSQLPLLVMMVAYTTLGLWILSLPLQAGVMVPK